MGNIHKNQTRGLSNHKLYKTYHAMRERCYNWRSTAYENYGGRGIKVCDLWMSDFIFFYEWALSAGYKSNLSLDRIDSNGNYEPSNCRWIPFSQQWRNKTNAVFITVNDEEILLKDFCDKNGLKYRTMYNRVVMLKWSLTDAINKPLNVPNKPPKKISKLYLSPV